MRLARIAIFLTGVIGLAAGGLMTISTLKSGQDEAQLRTNETLKSQATLLVDQFYAILENVKNPGEFEGQIQNAPAYVLERGVLKVKDGSPTEFESFTSKDLAFEEQVLNSIKSQISLSDLQLVKLGLGTVDQAESAGKLGIFLAVPEFKIVANALNPETIEKVRITLIDPVKAFPGLQKLALGDQVAYLVNQNGRVLSHSIPAFVGTDLRKIGTLKDTVDNLFLGAQTGAVQRYTQVDGSRQSLAMVRAGVLPFAFAVEQKVPAAVLSYEWIQNQMASGAARKNIGVAFVLMAIALFLFAGVSSWASRGVRIELERARGDREDRNESSRDSANWIPEKIAPSLIANAVDEFVDRKNLVSGERARRNEIEVEFNSEKDHFGELLKKIEKAYTLESVERELVSSCAELTLGGVAYFRYQRRIQNLNLSARSEDLKIDHDQAIQIYVRKDIELQVEQLADSGKVASLTHYAPIKKMISTGFQGRNYEAWAVTSTPDVSGQAKLVGVLVLIEPNARNPQVRPLLAKMLKESGNYLYAQGNKLRPKSRTKAEPLPFVPSRSPDLA
jgi:hypothetical protein